MQVVNIQKLIKKYQKLLKDLVIHDEKGGKLQQPKYNDNEQVFANSTLLKSMSLCEQQWLTIENKNLCMS